MEFNWVFYAVVLFVAGGTYFFTAVPGLVKPGPSRGQNTSMTPLEAPSPQRT